ncbi:MAG: response regulator [Bacteroidia bacterium]|jgi:two-component system response regulator LytT|nr:response regulator [Bacteroidia bacterium]MBP7261267.1 response regulator [Bacteroidia bacterium]MBP9180406.1 response regulator [Bacteroidia bacterium]MBP9725094.1 response regulator [Bacteroidia bacterium]
MEALKILIVEDESLVALDISDMLTRLGYNVLPSAITYDEALLALENALPDLVLVDIDLGGLKTGIDLGQHIRSKYDIPFVFITSHSDKATVSLAAELHPNGYLVKPFEQEDIFTSIEVAIAAHTGRSTVNQNKKFLSDCIFVKTDRNYVKVNVADILWLQSDHNYIYIVTEKGKSIVRSNFRELLLNLPKDMFVQVHKSYMVNLQRIDAVSHSEITMHGSEIPLSRNFKDELMSKLNRVM